MKRKRNFEELNKLKVISWNCNGLHALFKKKGIKKFFRKKNPGIVCFQETKLSSEDVQSTSFKTIFAENYTVYNNYSKSKPGSSGVMVLVKKSLELVPKTVIFDGENLGRMITLEFDKFVLICLYNPNSGFDDKKDQDKLNYRVESWDKMVRTFVKKNYTDLNKQVIICGDLNVSPKNEDIYKGYNYKTAQNIILKQRESFDVFMKECDLVDVYREFNPDETKFTYFSNRGSARKNNKGRRLDFFLSTRGMKKNISSFRVYMRQKGSDHVPIRILISFTK